MTIVISGLSASSAGQFPLFYHVPSSASGMTHVSDKTLENALVLLRVGTLVQRLKSMAFIETLF